MYCASINALLVLFQSGSSTAHCKDFLGEVSLISCARMNGALDVVKSVLLYGLSGLRHTKILLMLPVSGFNDILHFYLPCFNCNMETYYYEYFEQSFGQFKYGILHCPCICFNDGNMDT